jgi:O-acetylserine/cysteine efflux transporter
VPLIWGLQAAMLKYGLGQFPPLFMVGLRFAIMSVIMAFFIRGIRGKLRPALFVGCTQGVAHFALLYIGFQYVDVSAGIIAYQTNTLFTLLLGALILRERLSRLGIFGILIAVLGVGLIVGNPKHASDLHGLMIIVGSAFMFAIGNVVARRFGPMSPAALNATVSAVAAPGLLMLSLLLESHQLEAVQRADFRGWGALAYTALAGGIAGFGIWYWLLTRYSIDNIAPFGLLMPFFAMVSGVLMLGERVTLVHVVGGALTVTGVFIAQFGKRLLLLRVAPAEPAPSNAEA